MAANKTPKPNAPVRYARAQDDAGDRVVGPLGDEIIVQQCLSGTPGAWDVLYRSQHSGLLRAIQRYLGPSADANVVDEIAARVWYVIVRSDFALLAKFDAGKGCRLSTYLGAIARRELATYVRSERRRKVRELTVVPKESGLAEVPELGSDVMSDFLRLLTPTERAFCEFCCSYDIGSDGFTPTPSVMSLTQANERQLRHRVRAKLAQFFADR